MRIVLVDDEDGAREMTLKMLGKHRPECEVVGEANSVASAVSVIKSAKPDLVLLDIQLPDGTGFDVLEKIGDVSFKVVFVTAFEQHAVDAFRFSAIDYLLKPALPEDLSRAIEKVAKSLEQENMNLRVGALLSNLKSLEKGDKKVVLRTSESVHLIDVNDIVRCQSDGNYTVFILTDGRKLMVSKLIKDYDEMLQHQNFFRCHQSHLINLDFFNFFIKKDGLISMKDNSLIPVSVRRKDKLMQILEKM